MTEISMDRAIEALTLGEAFRLDELIDREALGEMVRSFHALFGIPLRVLSTDGSLLAEAASDHDLCRYVNGARAGRMACQRTVDGARRADPGKAGEVRHACFTGAEYSAFRISYDGRALGKVILGPYWPAARREPPAQLATLDPAISHEHASDFATRMPRANPATISAIGEHLQRTLDLLLFSGHKALLTSQMHLSSIRESYRELEQKNHELEQAVERLKELDRLKSNFLGTVSHELRTPLTSIIGFSEMLVEGVAGPLVGEQLEFVRTIWQKGEQLLELIVSLLDLSKLESGTLSLHRTEVDVARLIEDVASTFAPIARKRSIGVVSEADLDLPRLDADPERLRQVFNNLTDNAIKFSPDGGTVRLTATLVSESRPPPPPGPAVLHPDPVSIEIRVIDQGIGIPESERERIFDAFYQVDSSSTREYGGAGLGLSIVKRLLEAHGGTVRVIANEPHGSIFVVRLPVHSLL